MASAAWGTSDLATTIDCMTKAHLHVAQTEISDAYPNRHMCVHSVQEVVFRSAPSLEVVLHLSSFDALRYLGRYLLGGRVTGMVAHRATKSREGREDTRHHFLQLQVRGVTTARSMRAWLQEQLVSLSVIEPIKESRGQISAGGDNSCSDTSPSDRAANGPQESFLIDLSGRSCRI